jgi:intracellular septation protein
MKLLFDLFPVILFFIAYKLGNQNPELAAALATQWLGGLVSGGQVSAQEAATLWATLIAIVATVAQVAYLLLRGKRIEPMLWISLVIILLFGGATIWLHNESFIKWKPTVLLLAVCCRPAGRGVAFQEKSDAPAAGQSATTAR